MAVATAARPPGSRFASDDRGAPQERRPETQSRRRPRAPARARTGRSPSDQVEVGLRVQDRGAAVGGVQQVGHVAGRLARLRPREERVELVPRGRASSSLRAKWVHRASSRSPARTRVDEAAASPGGIHPDPVHARCRPSRARRRRARAAACQPAAGAPSRVQRRREAGGEGAHPRSRAGTPTAPGSARRCRRRAGRAPPRRARRRARRRRPRRGARHRHVAVSVGVGLHHRHQLRAVGPQHPDVVADRVEVDLDAGGRRRFPRRAPRARSTGHGLGDGRRRRRRAFPRRASGPRAMPARPCT